MNSAVGYSIEACAAELKRIYRAVQKAVDEARREGSGSAADSSLHDFQEEWGSEVWQRQHLPLSLELISKRFDQLPGACIKFHAPHNPASQNPDRYLLLMAGFSIEQLVLSIMFHYRNAIGHNQPLTGIVPFIGEDAWNEVQSDLISTVPRATGESEARAVTSLLKSHVDVKPGDPADVFRKVLDWSRRNTDAAIILDVTGGQKPMDTGGTYAAMYLGARAYYLDFDRYDTSHRRPYPDTLKYVPLALPGAVFSHDARRAVVELFKARRFRAALDRMKDIQEQMRDSDLQEYFDQADKDDINCGVQVLEVCNAWMTGDYCHSVMRGHELHSTFCDVDPKDPKAVLNSMLESFGTTRRPDLLNYLLDEYWRLRTMLYRGAETDDTRASDTIETASDLIREVVVGTCALAEVSLDAMFYAPRNTVTINRSESVRLEFGNSPPSNDKMQKKLKLVDDNRDSLLGCVTQLPLPLHRFPPGSTGSKVRLVREGNASFTVFLPSKGILTALSSPNGDNLRHAVLQALSGKVTVGPNDSRFEIGVQVSMDQLASIGNTQWKEKWGGFGDAREAWMANRNAIAHTRATATAKQVEISRCAIEIYLPRYLGVLQILLQNEPSLPITDEAAWEAGSQLLETPRGPWHHPENDERQLRGRLRLPQL